MLRHELGETAGGDIPPLWRVSSSANREAQPGRDANSAEGDLAAISAQRRPRILIVEDEAIIAWELAASVEELGIEVCGTALSAARAIRLAHELTPDLILMDVKLGRSDGVQTAMVIQAELKIPIVFCTAYANDNVTMTRMQEAGAAGVIGKPVHPNLLAQTLGRLLRPA